METHLCAIMSVQQCTSALLDMLNAYKHCPKVIIIHVGASDFSVGPAHQLCLNTQIAVSFNKQLFQACQKFKHFSIGIFYSLLLKEPWYAGWEP